MTGNDLQLVPTIALINELMDRYEHTIFAGIQTAVKDVNDMAIDRYYSGNSVYCLGLCSKVEQLINEEDDADDVEETEDSDR